MALQATYCRYCGKALGMSHSPLGDCGARDSDHPDRGSAYKASSKKKDDDKKDDNKK
jgi:hypothetical protein